jgi:acyl-CoA synthetase (NDP forming)
MYVQEEKMVQNAARKIELADETKDAVRKILDLVKADKRTSLTAPEGKLVCDAYGIPVPKECVAKSAAEASKIATDMGFSGGHEDRLAGYPAQDRSRRRDGGSENISRRP